MLLRSTKEHRYISVTYGMICQSTFRHSRRSSSSVSTGGGGSALSPPYAKVFSACSRSEVAVGCSIIEISTSTLAGDVSTGSLGCSMSWAIADGLVGMGRLNRRDTGSRLYGALGVYFAWQRTRKGGRPRAYSSETRSDDEHSGG